VKEEIRRPIVFRRKKERRRGKVEINKGQIKKREERKIRRN
jgi:hypothetical protein